MSCCVALHVVCFDNTHMYVYSVIYSHQVVHYLHMHLCAYYHTQTEYSLDIFLSIQYDLSQSAVIREHDNEATGQSCSSVLACAFHVHVYTCTWKHMCIAHQQRKDQKEVSDTPPQTNTQMHTSKSQTHHIRKSRTPDAQP